MANRDANYQQVGLGASTTGGTLPLSIDAVTGRLLIDLTPVGSASGSLDLDHALKDANFANTMIGWADDGSGPMAAAVDPITNNLLVDLIVE